MPCGAWSQAVDAQVCMRFLHGVSLSRLKVRASRADDRGVAYSSDLTDDEWELIEPYLRHVGKRGRRHGDDLRMVVDAIFYVSKTGCQWRMLPEGNGFADEDLVAVPPVDRQRALVVAASPHDNEATAAVLEEAGWWGTEERLELVLVDRGVTRRAAQRLGVAAGVEVRRVGWDEPQLDEDGRRVFRPIRHAWRVEVAHGRIGRARRLAKSFENTTASASGWLQVARVMPVLRGP